MAQTLYTQWMENMVIRSGLVTWEICKRAFLDRLFPTEKRDAKVEEFRNLRQGGMTVLD